MAAQILFCFHQILLFITILLAILCINEVLSDPNKFFHISSLCSQNKLGIIIKTVDGAVITSNSENNLDCKITFQTDTIRQRFMLRFEKLSLDCNDHLLIYDGDDAYRNHVVDLSCRSTKAEVGTIFTQGNSVTFKYTTDSFSKMPDNGFKMVITAYKEHAIHCREHKCLNTFCISKDLLCDNINHCGDNSDETIYSNCQVNPTSMNWFGLKPITFISLTISAFIICFVCVIMIGYCLCRRQQFIYSQQQQHQQLHQQQRIPNSTIVLPHPTMYLN